MVVVPSYRHRRARTLGYLLGRVLRAAVTLVRNSLRNLLRMTAIRVTTHTSVPRTPLTPIVGDLGTRTPGGIT